MQNQKASEEYTLPVDLSISTLRCRLCIPAESDIPHVFTATRYPGFNDGMLWDPPATIEELREPYLRSLESWRIGANYSFSIYSLEGNEFIGRIAIRRTATPNVWDIGFWTHPSQQGKGFMSEAAQAVIQIGFEKLNANRIEACHALWNIGSQKVLEKVGMSFVRYLPEGFQKHGEWVAENLMAIDRNIWLNARSNS